MNAHPSHIFTNYLSISTIAISNTDSAVYLFGDYGSLVDRGFYEIEIETDFETLYGLIDIADDSRYGTREKAIADIAGALTHPTGPYAYIHPGDNEYDLLFYDHFFALQAICREDEYGQIEVPEDISYYLHGYIGTPHLFPRWIYLKWPNGWKEKAKHYNRVLGLQYHLYLHFRKKWGKSRAMVMCGLTNQRVFSLARMQYQLDSISEEESGGA